MRSLARSALSCTARPCSSGGLRIPVTAFSCRSRSLATLSKPASSCRPCRSEASVEGKSESQVAVRGTRPRAWAYETNWDFWSQPSLPSHCHAQSLLFHSQHRPWVQHLFPVPPQPAAVGPAPTSRVLCLQHLVPLLECTSAPGCLLPHTVVLAAQAVRAETGCRPRAAHRPSTHRRRTLDSDWADCPEEAGGSSKALKS